MRNIRERGTDFSDYILPAGSEPVLARGEEETPITAETRGITILTRREESQVDMS